MLAAFETLCRLEGIIPALESAHALAYLEQLRGELDPETLVIVNLSGRGDKDMDEFMLRLAEQDGESTGGARGPVTGLFC